MGRHLPSLQTEGGKGFYICPGSRWRVGSSLWLDDLLARMLAEEPRSRPWDGAEVAEVLREGLRAVQEKPQVRAYELLPQVDNEIKLQAAQEKPQARTGLGFWILNFWISEAGGFQRGALLGFSPVS